METFSALAGIKDVTEEMKSTSETAITDSAPQFSYSTRLTPTQKNAIEEIDIRMKDFQEVTFFTVRDGRPLPPFSGTVEFLKPSDWLPRAAGAQEEGIAPPVDPDFTAGDRVSADEVPPAGQSAYRFLEGTPLSLFTSAPRQEEGAPAEKQIPEGSENIDDIL